MSSLVDGRNTESARQVVPGGWSNGDGDTAVCLEKYSVAASGRQTSADGYAAMSAMVSEKSGGVFL